MIRYHPHCSSSSSCTGSAVQLRGEPSSAVSGDVACDSKVEGVEGTTHPSARICHPRLGTSHRGVQLFGGPLEGTQAGARVQTPSACLLPSTLCYFPSALCPLPSALYHLPSSLRYLPSTLCTMPYGIRPLHHASAPYSNAPPSILYPLPSTVCL